MRDANGRILGRTAEPLFALAQYRFSRLAL
jgi:hypothetical protein